MGITLFLATQLVDWNMLELLTICKLTNGIVVFRQLRNNEKFFPTEEIAKNLIREIIKIDNGGGIGDGQGMVYSIKFYMLRSPHMIRFD